MLKVHEVEYFALKRSAGKTQVQYVIFVFKYSSGVNAFLDLAALILGLQQTIMCIAD